MTSRMHPTAKGTGRLDFAQKNNMNTECSDTVLSLVDFAVSTRLSTRHG